MASAEQRRAKSYTAAHPSGWYHLLDSADLAPAVVRHVDALGEDFAVFRGASGRVSVFAAHCPHLGANLAIGGTVIGDCLQCPFHEWRFRSDGRLDSAPHQGAPPGVRARAWPVHEAYGLIFIYYGPLAADGEPPYRPDQWPELESDRYRHLGRYAPRDVAMHLLEFAENSVDMLHLTVLHGRMRFPWTQWRIPGVDLRHKGTWHPDPEKPWIAHFADDADLLFRGKPVPRTAGRGHALFFGPASVVVFRITIPLGDVMIIQTHTPQTGPGDPFQLRVRFTWWAERSVPRFFAWYVVGNWVSQWWQDVAIWENKVHVAKPALTRGDGPVHELRRWFRQFYAPDAQEAGP